MSNAHINEETINRKAVAWMMVSVIAGSFLAFMIDWGETYKSPFLFASFHNFISFVVVFSFTVWKRPHLFSRCVIKAVICPPHNTKQSWYMSDRIRINVLILPCIISGVMTFPLFSFATKYIDIIPAIIIYEMWPIFLVLINNVLFRNSKRFRPLTLWTWFLMTLGLIGFGFVATGQSENVFVFDPGTTVLWGGLLALLAAITNALSPAFSIKHAEKSREKIKAIANMDIDEIYCAMISLFIHRIVAGTMLLGFAIYFDETWTTRTVLAGIITGIFITSVSGFAIRKANLSTKNLGVNALRYATPLFAVLWLVLFTEPVFSNWKYLIIGVTAIITANLLINCEAEIRHGYKSLVVALWAFGTVVYFREGANFANYYEFAGIVVTIFVLILSFRTDRLVRRTTSEEENMLSLWYQMPTLKDDIKIKNARIALLKIDAPKGPKELRDAYKELKSHFSSHKNESAHAEILTKINFLAHSKQQGANFGELISLFIIALITVFNMLFFLPPNVSGWNGFFVEMAAFLLASMVLFLYFNILDLQRDRARPILEESDDNFSIAFRDTQNRDLERWVSIIICMGITIAFAWLLWDKWLG